MTDKQTPPDWVLIEAAKRCGGDAAENATDWARLYPMTGSFRALCDMIQKYEQPPVDRKLLCAREAVRTADLFHEDAGEVIAIRAIELWESGYGS